MSDLSTKPSVSVPGSMDSSEEESAPSDGLEKPNSKPHRTQASHFIKETTPTATEIITPPSHPITLAMRSNDTHMAASAQQSICDTPESNKTGGSAVKRVFRPSPPEVMTTDVTPKHASGFLKSGDSISPTSTILTPDSERSEWTSPHAQATSRTPSVKSKAETSSRKSSFSRADAQQPVVVLHPPLNRGPPSATGSDHGGHRFTLKDLLASGPKRNRRLSASSRKSDASSDRADAQSATSLLKKYGVCDRVAIGKGATSVVRLAHKWDRSEEKLYAVKVSGVLV